MAWSVDRLGRSLQDLVSFLGEIHANQVDLYLHVQGIDTKQAAAGHTLPSGSPPANVGFLQEERPYSAAAWNGGV